jgi:short-subunit dehydrogenase involved in D-alanine esterification of teichoic acids
VVETNRQPELLGETVAVIGGSSGIGLETARRERAEGAEVILTGRNLQRLEQAGLEVGASKTAAFDATDPPQLGQFFDSAKSSRSGAASNPPTSAVLPCPS